MAERRNFSARATVVDCVVRKVIRHPTITLTVEMLRAWCNVPLEGARRILERLASCGLVREVTEGVFAVSTWPGTQRLRPISRPRPL
jgi:hypothetical protein